MRVSRAFNTDRGGYITEDIVVDFCNVLEMMAYVHDAVIGYYVSNGISLYRG